MTQAEKWEVERLYFREGLSTKEIASEIGLYETDVIYYINKMIKDNPRRGEIRAAAEKAYPYKDGTKGYICEGSIPIFIQGAEWADRTMIDQVCEWLENHNDYLRIHDNGRGVRFDMTQCIFDLRKAMKGE